MTLVQHNLDAGPEGGTANNSLTGSTASSLTGGSTTTFAAANAAHGPFGMKVDCKAASQCFRRWERTANVNWAASFVVTLPSSATSNTITLGAFANASDSNRLTLYLASGGTSFSLGDSGLAHQENGFVTGLTLGAKYRISIVAQGGSTTASTVQVKVYSGTSSWTTQVGSTFTATDWNMGADAVSKFNLGVCANSAGAVILGIDDIQLDDGRTTEIPDYAIPNDPPVVTAGAAQSVAAGATVNLSFTATDGDGTISSRATTFDFPTSGAPSVTGGSGNTPSFTAGAAGSRYVVKHTATDNLGATGDATTDVLVPKAGGDPLFPESGDAESRVGTWTAVGSTNEGVTVRDNDDATYVESGLLSETETRIRFRIEPGGIKSAATLTVRLSVDSGSANVTVRLYEFNILRQEWTGVAVTSTPTDFPLVLDGATVAAINPALGWDNLRVEIASAL